jgi:hypothetical protein
MHKRIVVNIVHHNAPNGTTNTRFYTFFL